MECFAVYPSIFLLFLTMLSDCAMPQRILYNVIGMGIKWKVSHFQLVSNTQGRERQEMWLDWCILITSGENYLVSNIIFLCRTKTGWCVQVVQWREVAVAGLASLKVWKKWVKENYHSLTPCQLTLQPIILLNVCCNTYTY